MTEELKPCPAGHTTTYIVEDTQIGVNLTATAFYGECDCGWRGPYRYQSRDAAEEAWNARAESAEVERLRARVEELEDKALRYDLDQAGIAMREKIDCELVDARARVAELEAAQTWRPIEGAPKDGTKILLCDGYDYCIARWEDLSGWYEVSYREGLIYSGLARWEGWMPLAPMPEES